VEMWSRAVPASSWGDAARTLAAEDLLIYLAAHFAIHHSLAGALWQLDLALVLERHRTTLDWDAIGARARRWGAAGAVYFALRAVGAQLGVLAPTPPMNRLRPGALRIAVIDRLLQAGPDRLVRLEYLVGLLTLDRYSERVRMLLSGLAPAPRWMRSRYASRWLVAAYLTHYGRVARSLARAMI
jgi:putative nucleotidyltransferase-like protein